MLINISTVCIDMKYLFLFFCCLLLLVMIGKKRKILNTIRRYKSKVKIQKVAKCGKAMKKIKHPQRKVHKKKNSIYQDPSFQRNF